jgi:hypothetical protein
VLQCLQHVGCCTTTFWYKFPIHLLLPVMVAAIV